MATTLYRFLWLLLLCLPGMTTAQELIPNGGFEKYRTCPQKDNLLDEALPWYNPNATTPDFYNQCFPTTQLELPPHSGQGLGRLFFDQNWAEYFATPLKKPLEAGECYYFQMYVATPTPNQFLPGTVGAYFSADSLLTTEKGQFSVRPQVLDNGSRTLNRRYQWELISGYFVAKGGERYVTIGSFNRLPAFLGFYYTFYDDISLKPVRMNLGRDTTLCGRSSTLLLDATTPSAIDYRWSDGSTSPTLRVTRPGTYSVVVSTPCKVLRDTIKVDYLLDFSLGPDTTLCNGQTMTLSAPATTGTLVWQDGSSGSRYSVQRAGSYFLKVSQAGCTATDSLTVRYTAPPQIDLGPDRALCGAETFTVSPRYAEGTFRWDNGSAGSRTLARSGVYRASVQNACAVARDSIRIDYGECGCLIYAPDAFTPNGDGKNDAFEPFGCGDITLKSLEVYTRWGELIFKTDTPPFRWDGLYQGAASHPNVYVWLVRYTLRQGDEEVPKVKKGSLTLAR